MSDPVPYADFRFAFGKKFLGKTLDEIEDLKKLDEHLGWMESLDHPSHQILWAIKAVRAYLSHPSIKLHLESELGQ